MTDLDRPTDEELAALIKPIWLKVKPTREAQTIRSTLGVEFDDPRWKQWVSDFIPDYVWDLVDIAAQRGLSGGYGAAIKMLRERHTVATDERGDAAEDTPHTT